MDTCFINDTEKNYLLTGSEQGLFLRTLTNGQPGRPALLCNNYSTGLSAVSYHNFLFYAYQTREHALLVRCYPDTPPLFRLTDTPFITYHTPQLVVFSGQLLLFYLTEQQNIYCLKGHSLLTEELPEIISRPLAGPLSASPSLRFLFADTALYLSFTSDNGATLLEIDTNFAVEELKKQSLAQAPLQAELTKKEAALSDLAKHLKEKELLVNTLTLQLREKDTLQNDLNLLIKEKESLQSTLSLQLKEKEYHVSSLTEQLEKEKLAHAKTTTLLTRAKIQYTELMQVAERYRDEATKWYEKYTGTSV